jgi:DNA polymerase elongation subunit (family B)
LPLATAVTTIGRQLIEKTKAFCEQYVAGSEIVYGDTDSGFWNVWPHREVDADLMAESFAMAHELVQAISHIYAHDSNHYIVLEFENVYR